MPLPHEWKRESNSFLHVLLCVCWLACACLKYSVSGKFVKMSRAMETEDHDWLKNDPAAGGGEVNSKDDPTSPALQQEGSRRRVDTMSSVRSHIGLKPEAPIDAEHEDLEHHELLWSRIRLALREPFAEFFGTFIMVLFGDGQSSFPSYLCMIHTAL